MFSELVRVAADAELRKIPSGTSVINLPCYYDYGRPVDGKKPSQLVEVEIWGTQAEKLVGYLKKGSLLFVELKDLRSSGFERKSGEIGSKLIGTLSSLKFAGSPESSQKSDSPSRTPSSSASESSSRFSESGSGDFSFDSKSNSSSSASDSSSGSSQGDLDDLPF